MPTPYLRKSPAKFIGAITSLKKKPTRQKTAVAILPLHAVVYQFGKEKILNYVTKAGGLALKNVSRIARIGYNYCLPHNKLITPDELRMYIEAHLELNPKTSTVVKVKMRDQNLYVGDVCAASDEEVFSLRCWRPELVDLNIKYNEVAQIHFMSDETDYDII